MQVKAVIEQDDKSIVFEGTLSPDEAALVVTMGLNMLYSQGLLAHLVPSLEEQGELDDMEIDTPAQ